MKRFDRTDLLAGLLVIGFGLYFAIGGAQYRMGTVARMGPGYVPVGLGLLAVLLGIAICFAALRRPAPLPEINWRQALCVLGSVGLFGLLLERIGMIPAATLSVLLSSAALPVTRPLMNLVMAVAVALAVWAVFVLLLDLPIPAVRNPFA